LQCTASEPFHVRAPFIDAAKQAAGRNLQAKARRIGWTRLQRVVGGGMGLLEPAAGKVGHADDVPMHMVRLVERVQTAVACAVLGEVGAVLRAEAGDGRGAVGAEGGAGGLIEARAQHGGAVVGELTKPLSKAASHNCPE
jgi:hypothetical protein